jgi:hypothetical protein
MQFTPDFNLETGEYGDCEEACSQALLAAKGSVEQSFVQGTVSASIFFFMCLAVPLL